jgi:signal transduction histidine kinase/ligand-binding sensor domain-containing protein/DNA-binding response OmpR family regulator
MFKKLIQSFNTLFHKVLITNCLLCLSFGILVGQSPFPRFNHLNVDNGLSNNSVYSIFKSKQGFVWFGTTEGLNCFDGYSIKVFKKETGKPSLLDNSIHSINEDSCERLWIGTRAGISLLNTKDMVFMNIHLGNHIKYPCWDTNYVNYIFLDSKGNMWACTHIGLFMFKKSNPNEVDHLMLDTNNCSSIINNVYCIKEGPNGNLWMTSQADYLTEYNPQTGKFNFYPFPLNEQGVSTIARKFHIDSKNNLWIGDQDGIRVFDLENKKWILENQNLYHAFNGILVSDITEDDEGRIWVVTDGKGLFIINKERNGYTKIEKQDYVENSLNSNGLTCIYKDKDGIIWIGSYKAGAVFYKKGVFKFELFRSDPLNRMSLNNNHINTFLELRNGLIWIGTNGGGVNILDPKRDVIDHIDNTEKKKSFYSKVIVSLHEDKKGTIWIGTYYGGLIRYNPSNEDTKVFTHNPTDIHSLSDNRIWDVLEDSQEKIWVATLGGGLNLFNRETGRFKSFTTENSSIGSNSLNSIYEDKYKRFWICSNYGLILFNRKTETFENYLHDPTDPASLSDNNVISIYQDSRDWLWVCTKNGLNLFDFHSGNFRRFTETEGLPCNAVNRVLEDSEGNLWMSTYCGLSKLTLTRIGNITEFDYDIMNFDQSDGLQGKEFSETAALKTKDGTMYFGGSYGFNAFHPSEIAADSIIPTIVFTGMKILNKAIEPKHTLNNRVLLDKQINHTKHITLKYKENVFTLEFAALTFFHPEKNTYKYKLEGFDKDWIQAPGSQNFVTYTNLNPGNYIFKIKGANFDNVWNHAGREIRITVLPPFYKSNAAILAYFILVFLMLLMLRYWIISKERFKAKLDQERMESKRLHELDEMKIKFFTNISHEIRTPLTLILSPVEQMLAETKDEKIKNSLHIVYRNSKRLLNTVNQLLDFRKIEVQGIRFNPSMGNIIPFIKEAVFSFKELTEKKNIQLSLYTEVNELFMMFDKDKIEKIIYNLLSNAFKFTSEGGKVIVRISALEEFDMDMQDAQKYSHKRMLQIKVKDTGIGIQASKIDKIFQRFFQDENAASINSLGSGIGLSLTQEFVKLHSGEIFVESNEGKGSTFTVQIPIQIEQHLEIDHPAVTEEIIEPNPIEATPEDPGLQQNEDLPMILIAEDNIDLRNYLRDNLCKYYDILQAGNGLEAYEMAIEHNPELIISDIMMPEMDGITLCSKIKSNDETSHIPFLILTAKTSDQQQLESYETGADDYIIKPFNFNILEAKIKNFIHARKNRIQNFKSKIEIEPSEIAVTPRDELLMKKALEIVEANISNTSFSVEELSQEMGMSRMSLYKKLVSLSGKPPLEFIRTMRLKRAAMLLKKSQLSISEIAYKVGFNDPKYFSKYFKEEFGTLPSKYIKDFRNDEKSDFIL